MARSIIALAILLYLAGLAAALFLPANAQAPAPHTHESPPLPATTIASPLAQPRPLLGFAFSLHHVPDIQPYLDAVDELAAFGVNSIEVVTPSFQQDGAAQNIRIIEGPGFGPRRADLVRLLQHARDRGMTTSLMPIVLFTHPRGSEWRGKILPDQWDPWWASYRAMLNHFIAIANEARVHHLAVGSELLSTEKPEHAPRWNQLIAHVRQHYKGQLYYSTNWDHYHRPTFWPQLDIIGINCYWDLTAGSDAQKPPLHVLVKNWRAYRQQVLDYAATQGKPVLLTEVAYPSLPWALKDPWNYINSKGVKADHHAQALGYESFLLAWKDLLSPPPAASASAPPGSPAVNPLAGVYFYSWEPAGSGDDGDTGYGIRGKPALDLIKRHLARQPR